MRDLNEFLKKIGLLIETNPTYLQIWNHGWIKNSDVFRVISFEAEGTESDETDVVKVPCPLCYVHTILLRFYEDRVENCHGIVVDPYELMICEHCYWVVHEGVKQWSLDRILKNYRRLLGLSATPVNFPELKEVLMGGLK